MNEREAEAQIAAAWALRGFSCEVWYDAPGATWEHYRHPVDEIVTVLRGEMEFEVDDRWLRPAVGEEIVIPANALHSARNVGTITACWLFGYRGGLD